MSSSVFGARASGLRLERMTSSSRFKDGVFLNTRPVGLGLKHGHALSTTRDYFFGKAQRVPTAPLPTTDPRPLWAPPVNTGLRATWLGHSTVLLEIDGFRVLTDPVWGMHAAPFAMPTLKRFQPVPVEIEALPPLDAVVISHDHYDHLDYPTILALAKLDVPFITSLGVGAHLEAWGVPAHRIHELDWWDSVSLRGGDLAITAAPSQHFSGRGPLDRNATSWSSFAMQTARHRVFFSGDTGLTDEYRTIGERLGPFDLVLLEIGAWHPAWGDIHLGPKNALEALSMLGGAPFLPVHWGTFNLALHAWDEPAETIAELARAQSVRLVLPQIGRPIEPAVVGVVEPWWRRPLTEGSSAVAELNARRA